MIDLSHLTEEEQGAIMDVLKRDTQLKKAEEERIGKMENILNTGTKLDVKWKYLTGEWFYEAKSRRHMDKIHGSDIILASMKQQRSPLDGSLRIERSKMNRSRGSDVVPPKKPARCLEAVQPQETNNAEQGSAASVVHSPRLPRLNPFNRASLIVVEQHENNSGLTAGREQDSSDTEHVPRLKSQPGEESSLTSGGSITSETSSLGFRPVPKKRTFLSRQTSSVSEISGRGSDTPGGSVTAAVPAPRRSTQRGSSVSSVQSNLDETPHLVSRPAQPVITQTGPYQQPLAEPHQTLSVSSSEREQRPVLVARDRPESTRSDSPADRSSVQRCTEPFHEARRDAASLYTDSVPYSDSEIIQREPSLPQSTTGPIPPVSYDLNFIDLPEKQTKKSNQTNVFKLSTPATSPSGEEDSIAKVLDWFNRSTDSSDWLDHGPEFVKSPEKQAKLSKLKGEDTLRGEAADVLSDLLSKTADEDEEVRTTDKVDNAGADKVQELKIDTREKMQFKEREQEVKKDERQPNQVSHMKSFWEKSKLGPKILIKSMMPKDKGQKHAQPYVEEEEKNGSEMSSGPGVYCREVTYGAKGEPQSVITPQKDTVNGSQPNSKSEINNLVVNLSAPIISEDIPQVSDQRVSDSEIVSLSRLSPQPRTTVKSRMCQASEEVSMVQSEGVSKQPHTGQPVSQPNPDLKIRHSPDSERFSMNKDVAMSPESQQRKCSSREATGWDSDDTSLESSMSQKRREATSARDRVDASKGTAEKIKQLRSFWEQERLYMGKPKPLGDGKANSGTNQAKLNKRFTKSEYDLRSLSFEEEVPNFTGVPLNQRIEKTSPSLSASRSQFNTLREFWDEASLDTKGSFSSDKNKSPKKKEPENTQLSSEESKTSESELYNHKIKAADSQSSPPLQNRGKPRAVQQREVKKTSKDLSREEKPVKPLNSPGKEIRSNKSSRKDSFETSSSRASSMRRATSMFMLSVPQDNSRTQAKLDKSPVQSPSRRQRQGVDKAASPKKASEDAEPQTPRARACVPRDYRHYLGMTDQTCVHTSLAPGPEKKESEEKFEYDLDLEGPVRASTPVSSEERYGRKSNKLSQRPLRSNYSSSDTGQESCLSSPTNSRANSRTTSKHDTLNPVKKALRRAEARPRNMAKSMEDMLTSLSPRNKRRQDTAAESRRISEDQLKKSKSVPMDLQEEMSGSMMTLYNDDGNLEVQGSIQFSINYIQRLREFHIFVASCHDLAAADPKRGRSDPYVKSYLFPDKANLGKRKTSVKKKTLSPSFNEILRYRVRMEYLRTQTLILSVWHHDTFGRNSFLGEVDVDLSKWDFDHAQLNDSALKPKTTPTLTSSEGRGEMRLAIRYLPQIVHSGGMSREQSALYSGEVHVWVKECKSLPLIRTTIDPYVKCFVLPDTSRKSRQKTRVLRRTVDPVFNHTMVYDGIRDPDLAEACVEVTVWDRDRLASNLLGGLRLGVGTGKSYGTEVDWMDSTPPEVALWEKMRGSPNEWVEGVLPLRMLNSAKTALK
ncbi:uncharacterized protein sytl2b isoform X4 [Nelusetta ayraudi]|uniref:uncharacterized protein sytl2b isoform X4 n=1 Tax=Nelusetta ayraudi TaxID=303726 RepID=UPI003F704F79